MTSEICIMNRLAVVLAADSATTVSKLVDGRREDRYFKGANKVFQISDSHPIGLMIYDTGDLLNVPWEFIVKAYRKSLRSNSFSMVEEYAYDLFKFLSDSGQNLFPAEVQNEKLRYEIEGIVFDLLSAVVQDGQDGAALVKSARAILSTFITDAKARKIVDCLSEGEFETLADERSSHAQEIIGPAFEKLGIPLPGNAKKIIKAAIRVILSEPERHFDMTGLVFAGFGDKDIFPVAVEFASFGVVGGKHLYVRKRSESIDHTTPALLLGFAQTSMKDTFAMGISGDVYDFVMNAVSEHLNAFAKVIADKSGGQFGLIDDLSSLVQGAKGKIGDEVLNMARKQHSLPLMSVLKHLPVDEMAGFAETLITLQSLKEKVTKPSERVGGPVDVAVITKHEGLVWIRRKHFFSSELNPRFALRQAAVHQ